MAVNDYPIQLGKGVDSLRESSSAKAGTLSGAESCVPRPLGGMSRPPVHTPLWDCPQPQPYAGDVLDRFATLGLTTPGETYLFKVRSEGQTFLHFLAATTGFGIQSRGFFYAGEDPATTPVGGPTFTGGTASITLVQQGFSLNYMWGGIRVGRFMLLGNGVDECLIYDIDADLFFTVTDDIVPPAPVLTAVTAATNSTGFTDTKTAFLRYITYENGSSSGRYTGFSQESNAVVCEGQDIEVSFTSGTNTNHTSVEIFLRYEDAEQPGSFGFKHIATKPYKPLNETKTFQIGSNNTTTSGKESVSPSLAGVPKRALRGSIFCYHRDRIWVSGNQQYPERIWYSDRITSQEQIPTFSAVEKFITITGDTSRPVSGGVTALVSYRGKLLAHNANSVTSISEDPIQYYDGRLVITDVQVIPVGVGAINQNSITVIPDGRIVFLSRDLNLYSMDSATASNRQAENLDSIGHIANNIDINTQLQWPVYPSLFLDSVNNLVWISVNQCFNQEAITPQPKQGRIFCYDLMQKSLVGPIWHPTIHQGIFYDQMDGRFIFSTITGALRVLSLKNPSYSAQEITVSSDPFTWDIYTTPISGAGYFIHYITPFAQVGEGLIAGGHRMTLATHWMDFGYPTRNKAIYHITLGFARNSRCSLFVRLMADNSSRKIERWIDQRLFDDRQDIRIPMMIQGTRLKAEIWVGIGATQPCTLKSAAIGYELQGASI